MASSIQILRSNTAKERPFPGNLLDGQPALNTNAEEPGLFFKATDGSIVKIGPAAVTSDGNPPNTGGVGQLGNAVGELWLDKSVNPPILKVYDGSQWIDAGAGGAIADGSITEAKLADDAVTSAKIADGSITNVDVNASAGIAASKLSFIQGGIGATTRTVNGKLRDVVSIKDFGAVGDNLTDDTAAIQNAINSNGGRAVYFPPGVYRVFGQINIQVSGTHLSGAGRHTTFIFQELQNVDTFVFSPPTAGITNTFLNNPKIEGLTVSYRGGPSTQGAGIKFIQSNGYSLRECEVFNAPEGITVMGGQLGSLKSFALFCGQTSAILPSQDTALLHFRQAPVGTGYQPCFTVEVEDFRISTSKKRDSCIQIANADGLHFSNGYVAFAENALLTVKNERNNSYIAAVGFTNVYFDCTGDFSGNFPDQGTLYGIHIPDDGFANSNIFGFAIGSGCTIGNALRPGGVGILVRKPQTRDLSVSGSEIVNINSWAIDIQGADPFTRLMVSNNRFAGAGNFASGAIRADGGGVIQISGNRFAGVSNVCCSISGNWGSGSITGNVNSSAAADLNIASATFANDLVTAGNGGAFLGAINSWKGLRTGNVDVTDPKCLDWYLEGNFTPVLTFNGASVGIAYQAQLGTYTRIGNTVFYTITIILTSKGSSTGAARITGLPYTVHPSFSSPAAVRLSGFLADIGATMLFADAVGNETSVRLSKMDISGGVEQAVDLVDAEFSNTAIISIRGSYRAA